MIYPQLATVMKKAERRLTRIHRTIANAGEKILVSALDYEHDIQYEPIPVDRVDETLQVIRHILKQHRFTGAMVQMKIGKDWLAIVEIHRPTKGKKGYDYFHSGWFKFVLEKGFYDRSGDANV